MLPNMDGILICSGTCKPYLRLSSLAAGAFCLWLGGGEGRSLFHSSAFLPLTNTHVSFQSFIVLVIWKTTTSTPNKAPFNLAVELCHELPC